MLESALKEQLKGIFANLEGNFTFDIYVSPQHEHRNELVELLTDVADCSSHISCRVNEGKRLEFTLLKNDHKTGITFREYLTDMSSPLYCWQFLIWMGKVKTFLMNRFVTG